MADAWHVIPVEADTLAALATAGATVLNTTYTINAASIPQISVYRGLGNGNLAAFILFNGEAT